MDILRKSDLRKLIEKPEFPSVSLYMPAEQTGPEVRQNPIRFKNLLKTADNMLHQVGVDAADDLLDPARHLIKDDLFWSWQQSGFALFCSPGLFLSFRLPLQFEERVVVTTHFHIKPLLPLLCIDGKFYVLALSQKSIRVLHCTRQEFKDVTPEKMPKSIGHTLQYDDPQRQLQYHTGTGEGGGRRPAMFHGQGVGTDEEKENLRRYSAEIFERLMSLVSREHAPVLLAGVDPLRSIFRQVSGSIRLLDKDIDTNADELSNEELHRRAWDMAESYFRLPQQEAVKHYMDIAGKGNTSSGLEEIVPASFYGQVETLFVNMDMAQWGIFDENTGVLELHEGQVPGNEDLTDAAAFHALKHGGTVYALSSREMPDARPLCAVLRY